MWPFKKKQKKISGYTREDIQGEIDHYRNLMPQLDKKTIEAANGMIEFYQEWLTKFDDIDTNHDGILDENETSTFKNNTSKPAKVKPSGLKTAKSTGSSAENHSENGENEKQLGEQ
jgi:hypothetical protein